MSMIILLVLREIINIIKIFMIFDIEKLLDRITMLIFEIDFYEKRAKKIRPVLNIDQIGYPCGLRKRSVRSRNIYEIDED